jgi:hypothetical protein
MLWSVVPAQAAIDPAQVDAKISVQLEAQRKTQALEEQLLASDRRNVALVSQVNAVRQRAEQAILAARQAENNAVEALRESEEKTRLMLNETQTKVSSLEFAADETQKSLIASIRVQTAAAQDRDQMQWVLLIMFSIICLALMAGVMALVFYRLGRRTGSLEPQAASQATSQVADAGKGLAAVEYLLDGTDDKGVRYKLQVPYKQLRAELGVIIGRSPQSSPYVINHADVSRKHARMRMMQDRIFIEDLGSTNGTSVNGQSIDERGPTSVSNGDQIIIGSVVMQLQVVVD